MKTTQNPKLHRAVAAAVGAGALLLAAGGAQAALENRDLDGDTVVDAFYDTDLDITWLRNADVNGEMEWDTAVAWAASFSLGDYDDWRLPTSDTCSGSNCTGSEMGHLWYVELGNTAPGPMTNTAGFQNLQSRLYWSGTEYASDPDRAWRFDMGNGTQVSIAYKSALYLAMAERPGDVAAVPEPQTYALLLAGLSALAVVARRRRAGWRLGARPRAGSLRALHATPRLASGLPAARASGSGPR